MRWRSAVAVAFVLCSLVSCSSTNRTQSEGRVSGSESADGTAGSAGSTDGAVASGGTGTKGSATAAGSAGGATTAAGGSSGSSIPGGTNDRTPLKLGFIVIKGGDALVLNALGTPVSFGDGKKQVGALVADLNTRGGINGRKVVPYYYEWNVADTNDSPARGCIKLAEDDHVFAILTVVNIDEEMVACAAKHKTLLINASFGAGDTYYYQQFGDWFFSPSLLNLNQQKVLLLKSLRANGRLAKGVRVGVAVLKTDTQYKRVTDAVIVPTLRAWGVPHQTYAFESDADISGAVLRFRTDGVNLVIFSSASAIPPLLFMRQADSQDYVPRYGMTDADDTTTLGEFAPRRQSEKVEGVGALPIANVAPNQYPTSPVEERCLAIMRAGGENDTNRRSSLTAEPYCEALWEFEAIAKAVTGPLTSDAFRAVFPRLGTSYKPVTTFSVNFANGRHDNAASYREFAWSTKCTCVTYRGNLLPVPR